MSGQEVLSREDGERAAVVAEARRWLRTPYHHRGAVLGAGVDCLRSQIAWFSGAGLIEWFDPGPYPADWHLHRSEERYADGVAAFCAEVAAEPPYPPATILLFKHGRTFSHGALVSDWPMVIHAFADAEMVEEVDATLSPLLRLAGAPRPIRAFDFWRRAA